MKLFTLTMFLMVFLMLVISGCSSRIESPVTLADSTIAYPAKNPDGISAKISLCRKVYGKVGKRIGAGTVFAIKEKENIYAFVDLENRYLHNDQTQMFHIDWIDPDGRSFYQKRIDLSPVDSTTTLNSSISVSPDKRLTGEYLLRIYLFRELIAEKKFELRPESQVTPSPEEGIRANIILYKKTDKKTGKRMGADTVFIIKENAKLRAAIELENRHVYSNEELIFLLDWAGPDGRSFYSKQIDLAAGDSISTINSSISISPDKRQPGECFLRLYLFDELIAEKKFELRPEPQGTPSEDE